MRKSLYWKLALAFVLVAFTTAALVALFIRLTSADRLMNLIIDQQRNNMQEALANYYTSVGSWEGVQKNLRQIQAQSEPTPFPPPDGRPPELQGGPNHDRRSLFGLADEQGLVLVPFDQEHPAGTKLSSELLASGTPILVNSRQVGTMLPVARRPTFNPAESLFLERTNQALIYAMLGALVLALTFGVLLARTLTRPLLALTRAAQNIAQGQVEQQVPVTSQDELGQLAEAFNRMSQEISRANLLRRQMTADVAHDLRTPLTVIAGYIESMRDGVLQPTPQRLTIIYTEIERLQDLVSDLRMLSQVDAGELPLNPQRLAPRQMLEHAAELFQHHAAQQNVHLAVEAGEDVPEIFVDDARMMQVLDNLISNALRYTPAGGSILLGARLVNGRVDITVKDTGSGIAAEELPYIFNRFHRADKSRHSESGESGLGLAIVKALVEAHKGTVWAESTPGSGTTLHMEMPV